jgi:hypothetical protein
MQASRTLPNYAKMHRSPKTRFYLCTFVEFGEVEIVGTRKHRTKIQKQLYLSLKV